MAQGTGQSLAVGLIDLNQFKALNDTQGHNAGDRALAAAARDWQSQLRAGDLLARVGGDEFAVLLPACDPEHLDTIVQRLKRATSHSPGCSIGVAVCRQGRRTQPASCAEPTRLSTVTRRPLRGLARLQLDGSTSPCSHAPSSSLDLRTRSTTGVRLNASDWLEHRTSEQGDAP